MRTLSALLMVLLLCSLQQVYCSGTQGANTPVECCYGFTYRKIPLWRITSYRWTRTDCSKKAVVFRTVIGKDWCVDPEVTWVKEYMKLKLQS
ncbi:monocyte chemotactic protein 1B-like isoform X3 [Colossoma macropomum]|uniref:monocyte chemotactic protein 1B-like isoform X3 n=1 Tax=Colossoma macropomum TaxID=42526 RepID=UPI001863BA16|nr:monocyte chemotactic protein 1B-like isoform X3 [Colossoma macropomum]